MSVCLIEMGQSEPMHEGQILTGALFHEPIRVETIRSNGPDSWVVGLVGTKSERFRKGVAAGLQPRHNHGILFMSDDY